MLLRKRPHVAGTEFVQSHLDSAHQQVRSRQGINPVHSSERFLTGPPARVRRNSWPATGSAREFFFRNNITSRRVQQTRSGHLNASSRQITYGNDQALLHQTIQGLHPQGHGNRLRNAFFAARASRPSLLSAFCGFAALQTNLFFSAATANNDHAGAFLAF